MKLSSRVAPALVIALFPNLASAFAPTSGQQERHGLQLASGERARPFRSISWTVPAQARPAWSTFLRDFGPQWRASFDTATFVPQRVYGAGIPVPGSTLSPAIALEAVKGIIGGHLDLFAPGSSLDDLELVANELDPQSQIRTIGFVQRHRGVLVESAQVNARIVADRVVAFGSEAIPDLDLAMPTSFDKSRALSAARRYIERAEGGALAVRSTSGPSILPVMSIDGTHRSVPVVTVELDSKQPIARYSVYLDAATLAPVGYRQTLLFASGEIRINAPERRPGSTRPDWSAPLLTVSVDGTVATTDANGLLTWNGTGPAAISLSPRGPAVSVLNDAGPIATINGTLDPSGVFIWDQRDEELIDAQTNAFISGGVVRSRCAKIAPTMRFVTQETLEATVNIADSCNAFSDGQTVNFFVSSRQCENTARLPDVVYHETGHSFHAHALIRGAGNFDTSLSEGASDYLSATITGDPGMGRGFFRNNQPLRHLDEATDAVWPDDAGEPHISGIIIGGAMWDLRKALITKLGQEDGIEKTDELWYNMLQRSSDIPSAFVEVLTADDDDGNLMNGTPNQCEINEAFARHGLADPTLAGPPLGTPVIADDRVTVPLIQTGPSCPGTSVASMSLFWQVRGNTQTAGTVALTQGPTGFEGALPAQPAGTVLQYRLEISLGNGESTRLPDNRADPWYERYFGEVIPLYCTDFERDPAADGFTHELRAGEAREGADDWAWGSPAGVSGSGDPSAAYSGQNVMGNDLGGGNFNGKYQPGKVNALNSHRIDVLGHSTVRLQYRRWLTVEDGTFDHASIQAAGQTLWTNLATDSGNGQNSLAHEDKEWRFHDVDLSASIVDGAVAVSFVLESDQGAEFGGWTIDDLCVVAVAQGTAACGNGVLDAGEACDDSNLSPGDGCEADCSLTAAGPACGNAVVDPGEACDDGNSIGGDGCEVSCSATTGLPVTPSCATDPTLCESTGPGGLTQLDSEGGCGCTASGAQGSGSAMALILALGLSVLRRRR